MLGARNKRFSFFLSINLTRCVVFITSNGPYLVGLVSLEPARDRGIPEGRRRALASDMGPVLRDDGDEERDVAAGEKRIDTISRNTSTAGHMPSLGSPRRPVGHSHPSRSQHNYSLCIQHPKS